MRKSLSLQTFLSNYARAAEPAAPYVRRGVALPRTVTFGLRVRAWRSMRQLRQFTLNDLLDINATSDERHAPSNLSAYLSQLERHGVLLRLKRREPGVTQALPGHVIWWLAIDLGWDAPVWRRTEKVLWNPNTKTIVPLPAQPGAAS